MGQFSDENLFGMTIRESATDGSDFTNPDADYRRLFLGEDGFLHVKDSAGAVTDPYTAGGAVATDAIWDAAGDLAVGSGANTAAKLTLGNAGGYVSRINGAVAWNSGTAFPTAAAGDRYYRTNIAGGVEFLYDGTRWVTTTLYRADLPMNPVAGITVDGLTTSYNAAWGTAGGFSNIWLVDAYWLVKLGATNDGSKYWNLDIYKQASGGAGDASVAAGTTQSLTAVQNHLIRTAINALAGTTVTSFYGFGTKVSTPSGLQSAAALTYRLVAT